MEAEDQYLITPKQMQEMVNVLMQRPGDILQIEACRRFLALDRWKKSGQPVRVHGQLDAGVMPGTIAHNRREIEESLFQSSKRTARLIAPLTAIEPFYSHADKMKVLAIGPRTEMELLHLYAAGFLPQHVSAVDLISSSPLIDTGDMHNLPYPERSFHLVVSGWAIAYSNRPERVMHEMIRVCKNQAFIALGVTYEPPSPPGAPTRSSREDIVGNNFARAADLAALIGDNLDKVIMQHEPYDEKSSGPVMIIARIKKTSSAA